MVDCRLFNITVGAGYVCDYGSLLRKLTESYIHYSLPLVLPCMKCLQAMYGVGKTWRSQNFFYGSVKVIMVDAKLSL